MDIRTPMRRPGAEIGSFRTHRPSGAGLPGGLICPALVALTNVLSVIALAAMALLPAPPAKAQTFPIRPIRIVVPLAPGGGTDIFARLLAAKLSDNLGQPVLVENRPGGGTLIGAELVARAAPDGYTLLLSAVTTYSVNPSLYRKLPYDPVKDFAPISLTARLPLLLVVHPDFPARSVRELIALAKSKPREIDFASPGPASPHHLAMGLLMQRTGIDLVHVPYKGGGPALQDVIAGRVPIMFLAMELSSAHIKAGKMRALGIASPQRNPLLPDVPTISESGVPGFEASAWQGIVAPAGTPDAIVARLNAGIAKSISDPAMHQKLVETGIEPLLSSPEQFAAYMRSETLKWAEIIRLGNISIE
jgi:tripartite-type tricarboxylate transporter receptor subunit TctC